MFCCNSSYHRSISHPILDNYFRISVPSPGPDKFDTGCCTAAHTIFNPYMRDVFTSCTCLYYNLFHYIEEKLKLGYWTQKMRYSYGVLTTSINPEYIVIFRCSVKAGTESQSGQRTTNLPPDSGTGDFTLLLTLMTSLPENYV